MPLRLAADENFNHDILDGLRRRVPHLDLVLVADVMPAAPDPQVLEWAAREGRVLLTHDVRTMIGFAYARVDAGLPMAGLIVIESRCAPGPAIADLEAIAECSDPAEYESRVDFVPL